MKFLLVKCIFKLRFKFYFVFCLLIGFSILYAIVKINKISFYENYDGKYKRGKGFNKNFKNDSNRPNLNENIIDYLHKLHKLKGGAGEFKTESLKRSRFMQPFYTIKRVFYKADTNGDLYLSLEEISNWIHLKTQEHIHQAIVDNYKIFVGIDVRPKNGYVSWDEYQTHFLRKNGFNESELTTDETDGNRQNRLMSRKIKEAIMRDRAAFSESAKTKPNHLDLDEFLSFTHPESSYSTIIYLVDEIYKKFDTDDDEILTEDEFSVLQPEDDYDRWEITNQEMEERRKEFREKVDLNKDGKATRKELLTYVDPKNPRHAKEEAEILMSLADLDRDGRLSLLEIFNKMDLFLESKMIDTGRSFHDEL